MTENDRVNRRMECDLVSNRIVQLLKDDSFTFSPAALKAIHKYLFRGIYDFACDEFELVSHIAKFTSAIWQVHAFGEGNTRTTAVFIERYLNSIGFPINNDMFQKHARYFRNALVRSNYANFPKGISAEDKYLERFFYNLLIEEKYELKNMQKAL